MYHASLLLAAAVYCAMSIPDLDEYEFLLNAMVSRPGRDDDPSRNPTSQPHPEHFVKIWVI